MSKILLCSALGLSGVIAAFTAQGCSSSSNNTPGNDGGSPLDTGVVQPMNDAATATDTGTNPTDSGSNTDTGATTTDAGTLVPSNVPPGTLTGLTPVALDINSSLGQNCTADTTAGTFTCNVNSGSPTIAGTQFTQTGAGGSAYVWVLSSLTVEAGANLVITGSKPGIIVVYGPVQIAGPITTTAGATEENNTPLNSGSGGVGIDTPATSGGGGGAFCGAGGNGFNVSDGGVGGVGGVPYGTASLVPLLAGSPGGYANGSAAGGGAFQLSATGSLAILSTGSISTSAPATSSDTVGPGGGSGGSILLESPSVTIAGTLAANGGGGGDVSASGAAANVSASAAPGGGNGGGSGAAGAVIAGGNGTSGTGTSIGGGGGGAGWIRINTSGMPATAGAVISPATTTTCYSVGPL